MSESKSKYEIVLESNKITKSWALLKSQFPEKMRDCENFLRNNPEDRSKALGLLKKLKGPLKGILQYDITKDNHRVWYDVDKTNRKVIIKYAGPHPD